MVKFIEVKRVGGTTCIVNTEDIVFIEESSNCYIFHLSISRTTKPGEISVLKEEYGILKKLLEVHQ